jgi:hypothetical protein
MLASYRAKRLLPIASKIFEKLLLARLLPIIENNTLLPNHHFGFRQRHSTIVRFRVRVTLRLTVSQYVLVSSPLCEHLTRYCFLFKSLGLEFVVLSLWSSLSDERQGLSFVSLVICLYASNSTSEIEASKTNNTVLRHCWTSHKHSMKYGMQGYCLN